MTLMGVLDLFGSNCTALFALAISPATLQPLCVTFPLQLLPCFYNGIDSQEMNVSGCLLSRGLIDLSVSLIPDGYKELPRAGLMNMDLQHTISGTFALDSVGAWIQKKHRVSVKKKFCLLVWTF